MSAEPWTANGYSLGRFIPDNRWVALTPTTFSRGRVLVCSTQTHEILRAYCFPRYELAEQVALTWDGQDEPQGWIRELMTARRRPDGDANQEYTAP